MPPPKPPPQSRRILSPHRTPTHRTPTHTLLIIILPILLLLLSLLSQLPLPQPDLHTLLEHNEPSVLILTAHPDDECMFFGPTLVALKAQGIKTSGLSLSQGNADGMGGKRQVELIHSYARLGVPEDRVVSLDDPELQDGMSNPWSPHSIARAIDQYPGISAISTIITFDQKGITGHPNHTPLSAGVKLWKEMRSRSGSRSASSDPGEQNGRGSNTESEEVQLIVLKTYPKRIKFLGPLYPLGLKVSWAFLRFSSSSSPFSGLHNEKNPTNDPPGQVIITSTVAGYLEALGAMKEHDSQLVWFRWLYVGASKYMWSNTLVMV